MATRFRLRVTSSLCGKGGKKKICMKMQTIFAQYIEPRETLTRVIRYPYEREKDPTGPFKLSGPPAF